MGWIILIVVAALVIFGVGLLATAFRWLLIIGVVLLIIGLFAGWRRRSS